MQALVFNHEDELEQIEVRDRFDFEDQFLASLVPARPSLDYREHQPSHLGVHVFSPPGGPGFEARPYLEFVKHVRGETHFHVMQEGQPTRFTVILR